MLLKRKKLYEVVNNDGIFETHYQELHLTFKSKKQLPLIMITCEDKCETFEYARVIWDSLNREKYFKKKTI